MKLADFLGLRKKASATLIRRQSFEDDQYIFEFDAGDILWVPGEHGLFTLPGKKINGRTWRAFSVASTPDEGVIRIATKITDKSSDFKQQLKNLQPGEQISVRGPFGWFYRNDDHSPMVMIALGVGITPIMAMARQQATHPTAASMQIIYVAPRKHLFTDKLDWAVKQNPAISINYVKNSGQANELLDAHIAKHHRNAYYYLSGAPAAVGVLNKKLRQAGIPRSRIISDSYLGY